MNVLSVLMIKLAIFAADLPSSAVLNTCSTPADIVIPKSCATGGQCVQFNNDQGPSSRIFRVWVSDGTIYAASMDPQQISDPAQAVACPSGNIGLLSGGVDSSGNALLVWEYKANPSDRGAIQSSYYDANSKKWLGVSVAGSSNNYACSIDTGRSVVWSRKNGWTYTWSVKWNENKTGYQSGVFYPPSNEKGSSYVAIPGRWNVAVPVINLGSN